MEFFSDKDKEEIDIKGRVCYVYNYYIFNLPDYIELDTFEDLIKQYEVSGVNVFKEPPFKGTISVKVSHYNFFDNIEEIRKKLALPLVEALNASGFKDVIIREIDKTDFMKSLSKYLISIYEEFKIEKTSIDEIKQIFTLRYLQYFGEGGVNLLVKLYTQKKNILENYAILEDYLTKKLSLEFYVVRQLTHGAFLISFIESDNPDIIDLFNSSNNLYIPSMEKTFYKQPVPVGAGRKLNNIFLNQEFDRIILIFNPNKSNYNFLRALLNIKNQSINYDFINYTLTQQIERFKNEFGDYKIDLEYYQQKALDYDLNKLERHLRVIDNLNDTIYSFYTTFISPTKKNFAKVALRKNLIDSKTRKELFDVQVFKNGIIERINMPSWVLDMLPAPKIAETYSLFKKSDENYLKLIELQKDLKKEILDYKKSKETEVSEKRMKRILFIFDIVNKIMELLRNIKL